jgi:hypothetical protein
MGALASLDHAHEFGMDAMASPQSIRYEPRSTAILLVDP